MVARKRKGEKEKKKKEQAIFITEIVLANKKK